MQHLLRALLLAAAALAVAASPLSSRKLLQEGCTASNPCKKAGVKDGCLVWQGDEYVCQKSRATQCLDGEVCDPATLSCVEQPDDQPDEVCAGRTDGCYHFSHHDGMCTGGKQSLCPNSGRCNADGTACEQPDQPDQPDEVCAGRADGCYHFSHHDGMCTGGKQSLCPNSGRCNADGTACFDENAKCEGKTDGCYTGHKGDYLCASGIATTCPTGTRCSSAATDATCV